MRITIFTPTYNRGYIIAELFESLKKQIFADFEWVIVDDGSEDKTIEMVSSWVKEASFPIIYKKVVNGGKHRAINIGLEIASGELFYIVDSDDQLPSDALKIVDEIEKTIPINNRNKFAGICGLKGKKDYSILGTTFSGDCYLDITCLEGKKHNITGDKAEVFYTRLLKKYKFPEFEGEKFLTESVVWDRIAFDGYKLRYFNKIIYLCEYLEDGLTLNYWENYKNNPKGYGLYLYQCRKFRKFSMKTMHMMVVSYCLDNKNNYTLQELASFLHMGVLSLFVIMQIYYIIHFIKRIFK